MTNQILPVDTANPTWSVSEPDVSPITESAKRSSKRVLLISYPFPPVGGAGVQRITKFVKYLPECGWQPSVLTVANPSVPAYDDSLAGDIPPGTPIRRAKTWEPSYSLKAMASAGTKSAGLVRQFVSTMGRRVANLILQPDMQALWMPGAIREGKRLLRDIPHAAIVASGPPFSTFLIGAALAKHAGLPLVLDYRDEWSLANAYLENRRPDAFSRFIQERMQRRVVRTARALVATTQASAAALEQVRTLAGSNASVASIYNGFDPADFADAEEPIDRDHYRLAYIGTLWNLTNVEPLVSAVELLGRMQPELAQRLEIVFAGRRTSEQQIIVDQLKTLPCRIVEHPYTDHATALELMRGADALSVLLSDLPGAGRVVPAKLFECMAAGKSILTIAPRGEVWDLLAGYPLAHRFTPQNVAGIAQCLTELLVQHQWGQKPRPSSWNGRRHSRPFQARQLAELLNQVSK